MHVMNPYPSYTLDTQFWRTDNQWGFKFEMDTSGWQLMPQLAQMPLSKLRIAHL